jgi:hypothetical protein
MSFPTQSVNKIETNQNDKDKKELLKTTNTSAHFSKYTPSVFFYGIGRTKLLEIVSSSTGKGLGCFRII